MFHIVLVSVGAAITFIGCAILFMDVIATKKSDCCQDEIPAEYIAEQLGHREETGKRVQLFIWGAPEFRYQYEGKEYQGKSTNVFFHLLLRKGQLDVPFLAGKNYYIYVNPAQPTMFVTSGEQRFAIRHVLGCAVSIIGIVLLLCAFSFSGKSNGFDSASSSFSKTGVCVLSQSSVESPALRIPAIGEL